MSHFDQEFPDFPPLDMPTVPSGFMDASWKNDACPHFENKALGLAIWIDFKDPEQREFPECPRFGVSEIDTEGVPRSDFHTLTTDNWDEVKAFVKAYEEENRR